MSEIVKRLLENHSMQNGDLDSIIAYAEYSNGVRRKAAAEIERLEAENIRLTTALENARKDALKEAAKWHEVEITKMEQQIEANLAYQKRSGAIASGANELCARTIMAHKDSLRFLRSLTPPTEKAT